MSADGLRPKAEGALRGATAAGVKTDVRMQQVTDEIFFDLKVAFIDVGNPRQHVHVGDEFALRIMLNLAFLIAVREARDRFEWAPFGDFFAGKIEFFATDPIDGPGRFQSLSWQDGCMRANEADFGFRSILFNRFGDF